METDADPALDDLVDGLAAELGDVSAVPRDGRVGWERDGIEFARVSASVLEVRLPEDIAAAALRTPDTSPIAGELGWIRFTPSSDERHVADRAEAWFHTAWRRALDAG